MSSRTGQLLQLTVEATAPEGLDAARLAGVVLGYQLRQVLFRCSLFPVGQRQWPSGGAVLQCSWFAGSPAWTPASSVRSKLNENI